MSVEVEVGFGLTYLGVMTIVGLTMARIIDDLAFAITTVTTFGVQEGNR